MGCQRDAPFQVASTLLYSSPEGDATDSIRCRCQKMEAIEKVERREGLEEKKGGRRVFKQVESFLTYFLISLPSSLPLPTIALFRDECACYEIEA